MHFYFRKVLKIIFDWVNNLLRKTKSSKLPKSSHTSKYNKIQARISDTSWRKRAYIIWWPNTKRYLSHVRLSKTPKYFFSTTVFRQWILILKKRYSKNIKDFTQNKTTLIVSHRISSVKDADRIIVLDRG